MLETEDSDPTTLSPSAPIDRSIGARWKHTELFDRGFVPVPTVFLQLYARLKPYPLNTGEAMFVLHLMRFKWEQQAPYPSYGKIAREMGISVKHARRHAQSLQTKRYLQRYERVGSTNMFDLTGLFDALRDAYRRNEPTIEEHLGGVHILHPEEPVSLVLSKPPFKMTLGRTRVFKSMEGEAHTVRVSQ